MAIRTMIQAIRDARKAYESALDSIGDQASAEVGAELGPHIPEGHVLVWTQFTPYFNDGEACHFRVGEPYLCLEKPILEEDKKHWAKDVYVNDWPDALGEAWGNVEDKDLLEQAFGDHVKVIVKPGGEVIVKDYSDHD